jgi:hypothetical protein
MINIAELLKDCPVDTKLYSPFLGYVWFKGIRKTNDGCIDVVACCDDKFPYVHSFFANGKYYNYTDTEVSLFPDKDQRDWSKFKVAKPKFDINNLKPFDKVLVRVCDTGKWDGDFYMWYNNTQKEFPYYCVNSVWSQCIPYENNEHLLGTTDDCDEFYKTWE